MKLDLAMAMIQSGCLSIVYVHGYTLGMGSQSKTLLQSFVQEGNVGAWTSPTLNQEVVATLLEVLLTHESANAAIEDALAHRAEAPLREGVATDLQKSINSAALLEARLTAIEWSQIALIALSGTQARSGTFLNTVVA
jgi:hypothetical protein